MTRKTGLEETELQKAINAISSQEYPIDPQEYPDPSFIGHTGKRAAHLDHLILLGNNTMQQLNDGFGAVSNHILHLKSEHGLEVDTKPTVRFSAPANHDTDDDATFENVKIDFMMNPSSNSKRRQRPIDFSVAVIGFGLGIRANELVRDSPTSSL